MLPTANTTDKFPRIQLWQFTVTTDLAAAKINVAPITPWAPGAWTSVTVAQQVFSRPDGYSRSLVASDELDFPFGGGQVDPYLPAPPLSPRPATSAPFILHEFPLMSATYPPFPQSKG